MKEINHFKKSKLIYYTFTLDIYNFKPLKDNEYNLPFKHLIISWRTNRHLWDVRSYSERCSA